jgi:hypothetical protein
LHLYGADGPYRGSFVEACEINLNAGLFLENQGPASELVDPQLLRAWLTARSVSRGLPAPVPDHGGWRVDVGYDAPCLRGGHTRPQGSDPGLISGAFYTAGLSAQCGKLGSHDKAVVVTDVSPPAP